MSLATACAIGLYFLGILAVLFGLNWLSNHPKDRRLDHEPDPIRRASRIERIEAARARGLRVVNGRDDGPDAA